MDSFLDIFSSAWILVTVAAVIFYFFLTWNFNHWKNMKVFYLEPLPLFGNYKQRYTMKVSFSEMNEILYNKLSGHSYGGIFRGRTPVLMIRDPELLRQILIRDFDCFVNRSSEIIRPNSYEESHLMVLPGTQWKQVRVLSNPIFSSAKIKLMSPLITQCIEEMLKHLDNNQDCNAEGIELKEFFGKLSLNIIASCAFGVQSGSFEDPEDKFAEIASKYNEPTTWIKLTYIISVVMLSSHAIARLLGGRLVNKESLDYLVEFWRKNKTLRENDEKFRRPDFFQLMLDAKAGKIKLEQDANDKNEKEINLSKPATLSTLTDEVVIGQSLIFLVAGFETSSALLSFAAYELALNPDIQERARLEVRQVLKRHDDKCSYEAVAEMPYLENVLHETLRKHPPGSSLFRECTVDKYQLPGTNVTFRKGDKICTSVRGIHYDERFYPDPHKFDPERFLPENKKLRSPYVYLPFGLGPRNCIGMRFGIVSSKLSMASLLNAYKFEPCQRTEVPYKISKKTIFLKAENGIHLKLTRVSDM